MSYSRPATRSNPACIVLLVDQSLSMGEEFAGDHSTTKCEGTARAINRLLLDLIVLCDKDPGALPRPYYDVGVIGYGANVGPAWGGELRGRSLVSIPDLALHPISPDEAAWVVPAADGATPMGEAFAAAGATIAEWTQNHRDSFPPIVINISDGAATDDPILWSQRLKSLATADGNLLLFNLNISREPVAPQLYPHSPEGLPHEFARALWDMSSPLTERMCDTASLPMGTKGFGLNADLSSLIDFLHIGTRVGGSWNGQGDLPEPRSAL